jgi:hypothetical protein
MKNKQKEWHPAAKPLKRFTYTVRLWCAYALSTPVTPLSQKSNYHPLKRHCTENRIKYSQKVNCATSVLISTFIYL